MLIDHNAIMAEIRAELGMADDEPNAQQAGRLVRNSTGCYSRRPWPLLTRRGPSRNARRHGSYSPNRCCSSRSHAPIGARVPIWCSRKYLPTRRWSNDD